MKVSQHPLTLSLTVNDVIPAAYAKVGSTPLDRATEHTQVQLDGILPSATSKDIIEAIEEAGYHAPRLAEDTAIIVTVTAGVTRPSYDASSTSGLVITPSQTPIEWFTDYLSFHGINYHPLATEIKYTKATLSGTKINLPDAISSGNISFMRTLRVPDDGKKYALPPSLGEFLLLPVEPFSKNLPENIKKRGGFFLPIYQREALWIRFPYPSKTGGAFKIAVGGVNAVSGLPHGSSASLQEGGIQDYLAAGVQPWLDGIATEPGNVKQVRHCLCGTAGNSYTVILLVRLNAVGPAPLLALYSHFPIFVTTLTGKTIVMYLNTDDTIYTVKNKIFDIERIPVNHQRLISAGRQLDDVFTLKHYRISKEACLFLVLSLIGGSGGVGPSQMGIAAGGRIKQNIYADSLADFSSYSRRPLYRIFVHAVSTQLWELATGTLAPPTSVTRLQYMCRNFPWFGLYDEHIPSISQGGQFQNVQSIDEIDYQTRRVKRARLMPGSEEREFGRDRPPQCDVCLKGIACVVLRPCSHCVCGTCLSKTALGGTTCLKCSTRIFGYVGFATPARNT